MAGRIWIGCSGWNYRHWRGSFYPADLPARGWFAFYANAFDAVEINSSFYRLPKPETLDAWRDQAPSRFRYAVKAPRLITHMHKLKETEQPLSLFLERVRRLGDRLGPILYQLPPHWRFNRERLEHFLGLLPDDLRHVFEFRDASWMGEEALSLLEARGASFCTHDMAGLAVPRRATGSLAYVRFHGSGAKYGGRYPKRALIRWRDWMLDEALTGRDVWVFFNNDAHADAIADARALIELMQEGGR